MIVQTAGPSALWRGHSATLFRCAPSNAVLSCIWLHKLCFWHRISAVSSAIVFWINCLSHLNWNQCSFIFSTINVLRVFPYAGTSYGVYPYYHTSLLSVTTKTSMYSAVFFLIFFICVLSLEANFLAGALSGATATLATYPLDMIRCFSCLFGLAVLSHCVQILSYMKCFSDYLALMHKM